MACYSNSNDSRPTSRAEVEDHAVWEASIVVWSSLLEFKLGRSLAGFNREYQWHLDIKLETPNPKRVVALRHTM